SVESSTRVAMPLRTCLIHILLLCSLLQPVFSFDTSNCPIIQRQWADYIGNRVIKNRRVDENVCGDLHEGASSTCCSREMLIGMAEATFVTDTLGSTMEQLHSQLRTDFSYKFRAHEQFLINFFSTIQSYLSGTVSGLPHLVSSFFDELLWRITQILLNTNSTDTYTKCVIDSLKSKQPFLRIPSIISNMTMEAFPPIRAAINSMAFARETLLAASITIHPSHECLAEYQRLRFCSLCAGVINANLCESTCARLAEKCTPEQLALGTQWKKFIAALQEIMNLVDKFPKVHRPLQMHLTDAIMNLKSVYTLHEQEILSNCSSSLSHGENVTSARSDESGRGGGGLWPFGGHRRARRQSPPAFYRPSVVYQQPPSPLRPHAFGARPLPTVALGEQGIASLQAWARDVKHRVGSFPSVLFCVLMRVHADKCLGCNRAHVPLLESGLSPPPSCWAEDNYNFIPHVENWVALTKRLPNSRQGVLPVTHTVKIAAYLARCEKNCGSSTSGRTHSFSTTYISESTSILILAFSKRSPRNLAKAAGGGPTGFYLPRAHARAKVAYHLRIIFVVATLAAYNKVAYFLENLGLEICNSGTPLFGGSFAPSNTCWNGTSLVPSVATQMNVLQGQLARPTDPTLRQKELGLQRALFSLQHVASSTLADPEVLQLADPAATTLKVGRNEVPVNSDEEALRSYLVPPGSAEASSISLEAHNAAAVVPSPWGAQPPPPGTPLNGGSVSGGVGFEPDTERGEEGSGYGGGEVPLPYGSPFALPSGNDLNNQLLELPSASHPLLPVAAPSESTATTHRPSPMQPPNNFASGSDDEDFRPRIENSGYEPMNVYGFPEPLQPEATQPAWPNQPQSPFDAASGVPLTHWDAGSNSPEENSGREPLGAQLGLKPSTEWTGTPQSPQPHPSVPSSATASQSQPPGQTGDAGLVVGEGKLDIPDQIWVPEGDGVAHQYPGPSHPQTTSAVPALAPSFVSSLFPMAAFLLVALRR
ncbi:Glypican-4, partial [Taenia solium]